MPGRFLAMAGALIWRGSDGRDLLLRQSSERDVGAGEWERVTGRLEQGEGFLERLQREIREETGLAIRVEMVLNTTRSYRGDPLPENEMVGVTYGPNRRSD